MRVPRTSRLILLTGCRSPSIRLIHDWRSDIRSTCQSYGFDLHFRLSNPISIADSIANRKSRFVNLSQVCRFPSIRLIHDWRSDIVFSICDFVVELETQTETRFRFRATYSTIAQKSSVPPPRPRGLPICMYIPKS